MPPTSLFGLCVIHLVAINIQKESPQILWFESELEVTNLPGEAGS